MLETPGENVLCTEVAAVGFISIVALSFVDDQRRAKVEDRYGEENERSSNQGSSQDLSSGHRLDSSQPNV